ncbi:PREDICTED: uncharacterized protein LOC106746218 [Dinoponera quadriceps]|uniref:Uncharacterized protein LOC106746218 n=1 Tax=Dinoponera quadriceps TaxID=609295 RepID=A0A6P3XJ59_DINQU|nr:PREDICTED: uncharacterized protein LOC106746218 [Dinoponera quadriceps]
MNPAEIAGTVFIKNEARSDDQFAAAYLKHGITHGITYQVKVLTWVAWKLLCSSDFDSRNWYLGTEVRNARGFHDLVLKYDIGGRRVYRFVQIKHKLCLSNRARITLGSLNSKQKKNQYSLIYLFRSYLNMLGNFEKIMMDQIVDMTVFTNVDIDSIKFLVPIENDPILGFEGKGKRYRIDLPMLEQNPDVLKRLQQVVQNDMVIYDFLRKLVFAIGQPSESELEERIVKDMGTVFSVPQVFYNDLLKSMLTWFLIYNAGTAPYLTKERMMRFLLGAQDTLLRAKESGMHVPGSPLLEELSQQLSEQLSQLRI